MKNSISILIAVVITAIFFSCSGERNTRERMPEFDTSIISEAQNLMGLIFDTSEVKQMQRNLAQSLLQYQEMRKYHLDNSVSPAIIFRPLVNGTGGEGSEESHYTSYEDLERPESDVELAFMTVGELSWLYRTGQVSSVELTNIYLGRLRQYGDSLQCLVTLTENLALDQARKADREFAEGKYRGPLHGIPYGVKDLLAVEGYKTTWGAAPYKNQVIDESATVVKKLEEAGAVLVAKLSMGALAMGDVWYGGKTKNPWNPERGSSGSSAGSAAATSAGLVGFAIGTETLGSIVSPSSRCGVTGLRPTFGRVSRSGAMSLSWSMDKIGPICRSAEDCAMVFDIIRGSDGLDLSVHDAPFNYNTRRDINKLRIGYLKSTFENNNGGSSQARDVLKVFRKMGIDPVPLELEFAGIPTESLGIILSAEAAAAFDELTRSKLDSTLTSQGDWSWPNTFRSARFIPAVEYIQANRHRTILMQKMEDLIKDFDVIITSSFGGEQLSVTNLTGHPCVVVPCGFSRKINPVSISFIGPLDGEDNILRVAARYQEESGWDEMHPPLFSAESRGQGAKGSIN